MTDQNFKTSFIPTKPIQPVSKGGGLGVSSGNFLNIIALIIFLISITISGGIFIYRILLEKQVSSQITQLETVRKSLDSPLVSEADRLNTRIESVKILLQNHVSPSEIFYLLEQSTLKTVQFIALNYKSESDGSIKISSTGKANNYEAVVLQSRKYGETGYFRDVLFSNLQADQQGGVTFNLDITVDKQLVLYKNRLQRENRLSAPGSETDSVENQPTGTVNSFEFPETNEVEQEIN